MKTRRGFVVAGASVLVGGVVSRAIAQGDATPEASPMASPDASPVAGDSAAVRINAFKFLPPSIEVAVGTTVSWLNEDVVPHNVYDDAGGWNSPTITRDKTYEYTFDTPGEFPYHCAFHTTMKGVVKVS